MDARETGGVVCRRIWISAVGTALLWAAPGSPQLIETVDYSDTFTVAEHGGIPERADGTYDTGSFAYGLRTDYVAELDAILPLDRLDISSVPSPGAGIFSSPSLSVFLRADSVAGTPHSAFPETGLPGIGDCGIDPTKEGDSIECASFPPCKR